MSPDVVSRPAPEESAVVSDEKPVVIGGDTGSSAPVEPAAQPELAKPVMPSSSPAPAVLEPTAQAPIPVVQVLSPRGVEYVFLTINLFTAAIGLMGALIALVNGKTDFDVLAFPVALLLVSVPLFTFFFLRLKKAELRNPALKQDPSKRRSTQFTQITAYLTVFFSLIALVTAIFASMAGKYSGNLTKFVLDVVVLVVVAGGILAYYWYDERKVL